MLRGLMAHRSLFVRVLLLAALVGAASSEALFAQGSPCGLGPAVECPFTCVTACGAEPCCFYYHRIEGTENCVCSVICDCS